MKAPITSAPSILMPAWVIATSRGRSWIRDKADWSSSVKLDGLDIADRPEQPETDGGEEQPEERRARHEQHADHAALDPGRVARRHGPAEAGPAHAVGEQARAD